MARSSTLLLVRTGLIDVRMSTTLVEGADAHMDARRDVVVFAHEMAQHRDRGLAQVQH